MRVLQLSPAPQEVAVARVPPGVAVRSDGRVRQAVDWLTWSAVAGDDLGWGAWCCTWQTPMGAARYRDRRERAVWRHAAQLLTRPLPSVDVVFVVHEQTDGQWLAVTVQREPA